MKNKIILILICLVVLTACGRKGDPEYQANDARTVIYNI